MFSLTEIIYSTEQTELEKKKKKKKTDQKQRK